MIIEFKENHYGDRVFPCAFLENDTPTNGDMIKTMFPKCEVSEHKIKTNSKGDIIIGYDVFLYTHHPAESDTGLGFGIKVFFDIMWWNAPYKREVEE